MIHRLFYFFLFLATMSAYSMETPSLIPTLEGVNPHIEETTLSLPLHTVILHSSNSESGSVPMAHPIRHRRDKSGTVIIFDFRDVAEVVARILTQNAEERESFLKRIAIDAKRSGHDANLINTYRKSPEVLNHIDSHIRPYQEELQKTKKQRIWCTFGGMIGGAGLMAGALWLYNNNYFKPEYLKAPFSFVSSLRK